MFQLIKKHPQKICGALLIVFGVLQAKSDVVQSLMPPKAFALFTIIVGSAVGVLGFVNTQLGKDDGTSQSSGV